MPTVYDEDRAVDPGNTADRLESQRLHRATGKSDPASDPNYVDRGINDAENYANQSDQSTVQGEGSGFYKGNEGDGFYKGEETGSRLSQLKKRFAGLSGKAKTGIGGGIFAGGIGLMSLMGMGSLQAVHLSQILSLDQIGNERSSDIRMNALIRYARSGGNAGELRISLLGSRKFKQIIPELEKIGVKFVANDKLGVLKEYRIDPKKYPFLNDVPREKIPEKLSSHFKGKVPKSAITVRGDTVFIDDKKLKPSGRSALVSTTISQLPRSSDSTTARILGGKTATWMNARPVKGYYNVRTLFHPFRETDRKITAKLDTLDAKRRAERERKKDKTSNRSSARAEAYKDLQDKTSKGRAAAGGVLLFTAAACVVRDAADSAIAYNREAIVVPQVLEAADAMAVGAQQQAGMDFGAEQVDAFNQLMTDEDGKSIWDAQALQAKTDPTTSKGEKLPDQYDQAFNESAGANTLKNLGGETGRLACSTGGQIAQGVAGLALLGLSLPTGGLSSAAYGGLKFVGGAVVGVAGFMALEELISSALEDNPIPEDVAAPVRGNLLAYGSRELANITARTTGGVELSDQESAALDNQSLQEVQTDFQSKTLFARMFDVNDYRSLTGRAIDSIGSPKQRLKNVASSILNVGPNLASMVRGLIPTAQAATPYNYGFNRYGIPERVLNNNAYEDPYKNAEIVAELLNNDTESEYGTYSERARKCFGVDIAKKDGMWSVSPRADVNPNSGDYEDAHCNDASDSNWDRTMLFVKDNMEMEAAACYLGEEESCKVVGMSTEEKVCSLSDGVSVANMPDWVKMPVVNSPVGGPVKGNINMAVANIKLGEDVAPSLRIMSENNPDFILLNEISETPLKAMEAAIPGYGAYRDPRNDNSGQALGNAIMWNKADWTLVDSGRIMIVEHDLTIFNGAPKDWNRYAVWGVFKRKTDGAIVPVVVTHHMTNPAKFPKQHGNPPMTRIQQYALGMDILKQLIANLSQYGPVLVGGDMNSQPDQGDWSAVPNMRSLGYDHFVSAVIYGFWPQGTKAVNTRTVPIPIGEDHGGNSIFLRINMNGAGPGSLTGGPTATTSTVDCDDSSGGGGTATPGSATMQDDYKSPQCQNFRAGGAPGLACDGQCVDFVKFRLKKHIDRNKFASLGHGKDVVSGLGGAGYKVDNTPAVNSVVSWAAGQFGMNGTYGHTAMVSKVNADGSIVVEEYNVIGGAYSTRKIPADQARQLSYAHTEVDFK